MASLFALFLLFSLDVSAKVSAKIAFEDGYAVSTVLDGNKLHINPHSILPRFESSDFIVLDSVKSAFYSVSLAASHESPIMRFSGGLGFADGDLADAKFNKPTSFAFDLSGNMYVADKGNLAIRKISKSGVVTTIAGRTSTGHADGPGKNASFSQEFQLAFVPEICALMISDRGNNLIRQIYLKSQDCARGSQSALGVSAWAWALGMGVSCLLGLVIGFAAHPYITRHEGSNPFRFNETWKHFLISQRRQIPKLCFNVRSAVVSSTLFLILRRLIMLILSHLSLMLRNNKVESQTSHEKSVSLIDSDLLGSKEMAISQVFAEQLMDLFSYDGGLGLPDPADKISEHEGDSKHENGVLYESHPRIGKMIQDNLVCFEKQATKVPLEECLVNSSGLVKRK